jgi:hypothetical protein
MSATEAPIPSPFELSREILIAPLEMQEIADLTKGCLNAAAEHDWAIVSDRSQYLEIPHHNGLRTPDIRLGLSDTRFSSIDIDLPRKDEDTAIVIHAHAIGLPGRVITLREFQFPDQNGDRKFFADDSHARAWAHNHKPIDPVLEQSEVANWLYGQAGLTSVESGRKIKSESDPVRNACDILSSRAKQHFSIRQIKFPLNHDLELHGQIVESLDTDNPLSPPVARHYSAWVNQYHDINNQQITERLIVEFSPEDILLATDMSPLSSVKVNMETTNPNFNLGKAIVGQAVEYEDGGAIAVLAKVYDRLQKYELAS